MASGASLRLICRFWLMAGMLALWLPFATSAQTAAPDFEEWALAAERASSAIGDRRTTDLALDQLRVQIAEWRATFLESQTENTTQIDTVRSQIDALGPVPETEAEPPQIAKRRAELTRALGLLQAPGLEAEEAYRNADGLIADIDRITRDRQADALMTVWPAPVNPANWPAGIAALSQALVRLATEVGNAWGTGVPQIVLGANLPAILAYLAVALVLLNRGRRWMERLTLRLTGTSAQGRTAYGMVMSLGQVLLPLAGVFLLVAALRLTGLIGLAGDAVLDVLPMAGFCLFAGRWLGLLVFPKGTAPDTLLQLPPERRAEGRFHAAMLGVVLALNLVRQVLVIPVANVEAANAVVIFPLMALAGLLVFRIGQLLRLHVANDDVPGEATNYRNRLIGLIGRAAILLGIAGPLISAVGYVAAAQAFLFPAALSLALMAALIVAQRLVSEIYGLILRADDRAREALVPVLVGFGLTVASLPVFAMIWGARATDISEIWVRVNQGLSLGGARISPIDFVKFLAMFGIGYGLTRLFQGALRTSILPKTAMDKGGQNAIVSGVGYIGIFLAALIAITAAGIDLSSLAIVAGALSVGIGFGLQNIVSNFVSGIILLVERPVSEGDWIEVRGVMGIVKSISVRSTRIETFDRTDVIVPNADLVSGMVTNWTRFNLNGRLIVPVAVAYGTDPRLVEKVLLEIAEAQPLVVLNPRPTANFITIGPDSLQFELRVILCDVNFKPDVQSAINYEIVQRFEAAGIVFPFWARNPDGLTAIGRYEAHRDGNEPAPEPPPEPAPPPEPPPMPRATAMVWAKPARIRRPRPVRKPGRTP